MQYRQEKGIECSARPVPRQPGHLARCRQPSLVISASKTRPRVITALRSHANAMSREHKATLISRKRDVTRAQSNRCDVSTKQPSNLAMKNVTHSSATASWE
jgi:hypothetical protein